MTDIVDSSSLDRNPALQDQLPSDSSESFFDISDQLHPPGAEGVRNLQIDDHIVRLTTKQIKPGETEKQLGLETEAGRIKILLAYILSEYADLTEVEYLPSAAWLIERYKKPADSLYQAHKAANYYPDLAQNTRASALYDVILKETKKHSIVPSNTMLYISDKIKTRHTFPETEIADLVLRQFYLDVAEHALDNEGVQPVFCLVHRAKQT